MCVNNLAMLNFSPPDILEILADMKNVNLENESLPFQRY